MREVKLCTEAQKVLDKWTGGIQDEKVHIWEQDETYFVVLRQTHSDEDAMYFLRIFPMSDAWVLSCDKEYKL